jgi:hypothetical protein
VEKNKSYRLIGHISLLGEIKGGPKEGDKYYQRDGQPGYTELMALPTRINSPLKGF